MRAGPEPRVAAGGWSRPAQTTFWLVSPRSTARRWAAAAPRGRIAGPQSRSPARPGSPPESPRGPRGSCSACRAGRRPRSPEPPAPPARSHPVGLHARGGVWHAGRAAHRTSPGRVCALFWRAYELGQALLGLEERGHRAVDGAECPALHHAPGLAAEPEGEAAHGLGPEPAQGGGLGRSTGRTGAGVRTGGVAGSCGAAGSRRRPRPRGPAWALANRGHTFGSDPSSWDDQNMGWDPNGPRRRPSGG